MTPEDRLQHMIESARATGGRGVGETDWSAFAARAHRALFMRRAAVASGALALIVVAAFSAVFLLRGTDDPSPLPAAVTPAPSETAALPTPHTSPSSPAPAPAPVEPFAAEVWLVDGDGVLFFGTTNVPYADEPGEVSSQHPAGSIEQRLAVVLEALLEGPTGPDVESGAGTAIPEGTRLLGVAVDGRTGVIDLSEEFEAGGGSLSMQLRLGQVVFQATQVEGIDEVLVTIEGEQVASLGGEGVVVEKPLARADFENVAPPIVLITPTINSRLSSPVRVEGIANVFEANVNIRILDANGKPIEETFTTATCGTGCWGTYSERVRFDVPVVQEGTLEVLTYSAEDGSPQDVINIPVTLTP